MKKLMKTLTCILLSTLVLFAFTGCKNGTVTQGDYEKALKNLSNYTITSTITELDLEDEKVIEEETIVVKLYIDGTNGKLTYGEDYEKFYTSSSKSIEEQACDYIGYVHMFFQLNYNDYTVDGSWLTVKKEVLESLTIDEDFTVTNAKIKVENGYFKKAEAKAIETDGSEEAINISFEFSDYGKTKVSVSKLVLAYNTVYNNYGYSLCYDISSDKSYISFDSNYFDYDDYTTGGSNKILKAINSALGLPDYIYASMVETTALMGKQTEIYNGIKVSWSFHPDKGLEAMYIEIDS